MKKSIVIAVALIVVFCAILTEFCQKNRPMSSWINRISVVRRIGADLSRFFSSEPPASVGRTTLKMLTNEKCRNSVYPRTKLNRFNVPDLFLKWETDFPDYTPISYTSDSIKGQPWADPEKLSEGSPWNRVDSHNKIDRKSHEGEYRIVDGIPLNPIGRTGVKGRGCLGRWGPNHAADPIVTRWKVNEKGERIKHPKTGKPILQFISIQRRDSGEWAIPGGMVDPGELVTATLRREFGEEALNSLEANEHNKGSLEKKIDDLFQHGFEIYRGYVDDPRNTDNAWMETVAYNFHDKDGNSVARFKLHAGDDAVGVKWMDIGCDVKLYASHADMIRKVAEHHNAHW